VPINSLLNGLRHPFALGLSLCLCGPICAPRRFTIELTFRFWPEIGALPLFDEAVYQIANPNAAAKASTPPPKPSPKPKSKPAAAAAAAKPTNAKSKATPKAQSSGGLVGWIQWLFALEKDE
jgi:hypothetical protein